MSESMRQRDKRYKSDIAMLDELKNKLTKDQKLSEAFRTNALKELDDLIHVLLFGSSN